MPLRRPQYADRLAGNLYDGHGLVTSVLQKSIYRSVLTVMLLDQADTEALLRAGILV